MKKYTPIRFVISGFLITAALQFFMPLSCKKQIDPITPIDETGQVDTRAVQKTTQTAEEAFLNEDVPKVISMLSYDASTRLKDVVPQLKPHLKSYGEAFKTRKLEFATPFYAEYSFTYNGKRVSVAFSHTDENTWKLMRL